MATGENLKTREKSSNFPYRDIVQS